MFPLSQNKVTKHKTAGDTQLLIPSKGFKWVVRVMLKVKLGLCENDLKNYDRLLIESPHLQN